MISKPISIIVARSKNNIIGKNNGLPWRLPEDLKWFKKMTTGNVVIMGKNTYDSIGKPLPNRMNIVVSRTMPSTEGIFVVRSLEEASMVATYLAPEKNIFVIGGRMLYETAMPLVDKLIITEINESFEGDVSFVDFDKSSFTENELGSGVSNTGLEYRFVEYTRKRGE